MSAPTAGHHVTEPNTQQINLRMATPLKIDNPHSINTELKGSLPVALTTEKLSVAYPIVDITQTKCV